MSLTNKVPEKDVNELFTRIAPKYDLMNNVVSLGIQNFWRKDFLKNLKVNPQDECLDLCCGTADSTIALARRCKLVTGLDFNEKMLEVGKAKVRKQHLQSKIKFVKGDAMHLPFAPQSFACVTTCFGLRNVPDASKTIAEAYRVLKPGGQFAILEMSQPTNPMIKIGWKAYFKIFPYFAQITGNTVKDYQYLSQTTKEFLTAEQLKKLLEQKGFTQVAVKKLTFGAGAIHIGIKPCD